MYPDPTMFGFCSRATFSYVLFLRKPAYGSCGSMDQDLSCSHLNTHRLRIDAILISIVLRHAALPISVPGLACTRWSDGVGTSQSS